MFQILAHADLPHEPAGHGRRRATSTRRVDARVLMTMPSRRCGIARTPSTQLEVRKRSETDAESAPVLVPIHTGKLPHVRENVLQAVRELERVHISEPVLDDAINNQLREPQDLARQVEGVAEPACHDTAS